MAVIECFGAYFLNIGARNYKTVIAKECANVFRSTLIILKDQLQEIRELKDVIARNQMEWKHWNDDCPRPVAAIAHKLSPRSVYRNRTYRYAVHRGFKICHAFCTRTFIPSTSSKPPLD